MKFAPILLSLFTCAALGQSVPNGTIIQDKVWTPAQWNAAWEAKVDVTGGVLYSPAINGGISSNGTINSTQPFTYGWGNTAVGLSCVTNNSQPAQVMGSFGTPSNVALYSERDSVGFFCMNTAPAALANVPGSFTTTTFVPTSPLSSTITAKLEPTMLIDTSDGTKYTGQVVSWVTNGSGQATSITVSGWFQVGNTAAGQTPSGPNAIFNPVTKAFGGNIVVQIPVGAYATAGAGLEIDLNDTSGNGGTNTTWGYDCNNLTVTAGRDCYIARGAWDYGFQANLAATAGFYVPASAAVSAGYLYSNNAGTAFQVNANPAIGFLTTQATGTAFQANSTMVSGFYFKSGMFNVAYTGQVDIGSETSSSTAPIVMHSSGHAGGDASISVSGGTGATDGTLSFNAAKITGPTILLTPIAIASLPSCAGGTAGMHASVNNGVASPTYLGTVSTTGSATDSVFCNGSNWVYD